MTNSFTPPRPFSYTPPLPLDATAVLDILAAHDPALYNRVMQISAEHCRCAMVVQRHAAKALDFQNAQMSGMECKRKYADYLKPIVCA